MEKLTIRQSEILDYLLNHTKPVAVKKLAEEIGISVRTARYDLDKIEYVLKLNGLCLRKKTNVGIWLEEPEKVRHLIQEYLTPSKHNRWLLESSQDRVENITAYLLAGRQYITMGELGEEFEISRSTIVKDLQQVKHWAESRDLTLVKKPNLGVCLMGEELQYRQVWKEYMAQHPDKNFSLFSPEEHKVFLSFVEAAAEEIRVVYSDEAIRNFIIHLEIMLFRFLKGDQIVLKKEKLDELRQSQEFQFLQTHKSLFEELYERTLPEDEIGFLAMHLTGMKVTKKLNDQDSYFFHRDQELTERYIREVSRLLNLDLTQDKTLQENLLLHFHAAVYRLENGLGTENPILPQIMKKYPYIYQTAEIAAKSLEDTLQLPITKDEIGFLAMHIGAGIERSRSQSPSRYKALVVCNGGVGTSMLLSARLNREFSEIEIVDETPVSLIQKKLTDEVDLIITTVPLNEVLLKPSIVVSPLLENSDIKRVRELLRFISGESREHTAGPLEETLNELEQFCVIRDRKGLKNFLKHVLNEKFSEPEKQLPHFSEMLDIRRIELQFSAKSKNEAIRRSGSLLFRDGYIRHEYIDMMVSLSNQLNAYIVIAPEVAMPHAGPADGALKSGFSLLTLKEPIVFGHEKNDPVSIVIALAAADSDSHRNAIHELSIFLNSPENIQRLKNAGSPEEVLTIIQNFEKELLYHDRVLIFP